jgi:hypothetical protein
VKTAVFGDFVADDSIGHLPPKTLTKTEQKSANCEKNSAPLRELPDSGNNIGQLKKIRAEWALSNQASHAKGRLLNPGFPG